MMFSKLSSDTGAILAALNKSQAVIEFKLDGTILTANENFLRAMGYSLDEIKGRHHSMFVEPAYKESVEYRQFWEKLGRGEFQAAQYRRFGKGGKEIWIEASYTPILDKSGRPYKVVKFATDISAQKALLADMTGKIEAISRVQPVIEFQLAGTTIPANYSYVSVMGYRLDVSNGKHHWMFAEPAYEASGDYREFWAKLNRGEFQAAQYKRLGKG